jgi:hypothetical protein
MLRTINHFRKRRVTTALVTLFFMAVQLPISLLAAPSAFADTPSQLTTEQQPQGDVPQPANLNTDPNTDPQCDNSDCNDPSSQQRTAVPATFEDITCDQDGSYTIPTTAGVVYKVNGSIATNGTYTIASPQTVTVNAYPQSGYVLDGADTWTHNFTDPGNCLEEVTAAPVIFSDMRCGLDGSYTIPRTRGVNYLVDGSVVAGGRVTIGSPQSVTVTALAQDGFSLNGTASWAHTFLAPENCNHEHNQSVVICERTTTIHNPYIRITVPAWQADGDHLVNHIGPVFNTNMNDGDTWGDIIPPTDGNNGLNWNAEGQLLYNNTCNVPVVVSTDVCLNIPGIQKKVPEGMEVDKNCICFVKIISKEVPPPVTPPAPAEVVSLVPAPPAAPLPAGGMGAGPEEELVNTGTNLLPTLLAGTGILGAAVATGIFSRKSARATSVTKATKTSQ